MKNSGMMAFFRSHLAPRLSKPSVAGPVPADIPVDAEHTVATPAYQFTGDYFSQNIPVFQDLLRPLTGQPCSLLEIGSFEGRSAIWLLDHVMTNPDSKLDCIDIIIRTQFCANIKMTGRARQVSVHAGPSRLVLRGLPVAVYDFVYVDGSHWTSDVLEDAVLSFGLLKLGGMMAFDDYLWDDPAFNQHGTPKPAVDIFLDVFSRKIELLHKNYQVWVRKISE